MKRTIIFALSILLFVVIAYRLSSFHATEVERAYKNGALASDVNGMVLMALVRDAADKMDKASTIEILDDILVKELEFISTNLDSGATLYSGSSNLATGNACEGLKKLREVRSSNAPERISGSAEIVWKKLNCDAIRSQRSNQDA